MDDGIECSRFKKAGKERPGSKKEKQGDTGEIKYGKWK